MIIKKLLFSIASIIYELYMIIIYGNLLIICILRIFQSDNFLSEDLLINEHQLNEINVIFSIRYLSFESTKTVKN